MKTLYKAKEYTLFLLLTNRSNAYLIQFADGTNVICDCGAKIQGPRLKWELYKNKIKNVDYLILTHTHFDHCSNAAYLKEKFQCKIIVHASEKNYLENGFSTLPHSHYRQRDTATRILNSYGRFLVLFKKASVDIDFEKEYHLSLANCRISLCHTPGHSRGSSVCTINNEIALIGDTMVHVKYSRIFPAFVDDVSLLFYTWDYIAHKIPAINFYPGHGNVISRQLFLQQIPHYKNKYLKDNS